MDVLNKEVIFVGGKGGVGKSTSAAAIALRSAAGGHRTLLVSTDPAHNTGDIFGRKLDGEITKVAERLSALEIDPDKETEVYIGTVKKNLKDVVHSAMADEVNRQLDTAKASPGADEAALFDRLVTILLEESGRFDRIIFDTAPTGHTIRLLTLPELMGVWIRGLLERRKKTNENYSALLNDGDPVEDPIYDVLRERQDRFTRVRGILLDPEKTGFIFVLNPERLPILETEKAVSLLGRHHLHVRTLIVNKVLPEEADGEFLRERRVHERGYLKLIEETFEEQELIRVPLFPRDITSMEDLEAFSQHFKAGGQIEGIRL
ncbi:ArsA family ATPase [Bhargavaea beijingensis]|uniref:ArsA family ATPase n=1 Tax=Bhargavaea beijingensis TaxID=426756 RepID=A0A1G7D7H1_9BACL|nr:ArsA family ATPase [Bhargavaea beijingensis]MCW1929195.1 ArsA family ATPase [Bhargavaea beijingensis]RSK24484.1 ArsA family ATPase [Bhargavaea beijingensis]SDE47449.1 arsenite-transporting ATPase [Bhargavaea beijingensis]